MRAAFLEGIGTCLSISACLAKRLLPLVMQLSNVHFWNFGVTESKS